MYAGEYQLERDLWTVVDSAEGLALSMMEEAQMQGRRDAAQHREPHVLMAMTAERLLIAGAPSRLQMFSVTLGATITLQASRKLRWQPAIGEFRANVVALRNKDAVGSAWWQRCVSSESQFLPA